MPVYNHRVSGIRASLVPCNDVSVLAENVNYLAFAFIAPLSADYYS
jgi:hypothetical protein